MRVLRPWHPVPLAVLLVSASVALTALQWTGIVEAAALWPAIGVAAGFSVSGST